MRPQLKSVFHHRESRIATTIHRHREYHRLALRDPVRLHTTLLFQLVHQPALGPSQHMLKPQSFLRQARAATLARCVVVVATEVTQEAVERSRAPLIAEVEALCPKDQDMAEADTPM